MLNTVLIFATEMAAEAGEAAHEGFGLNLNPLQTNLINLSILVGLLVFYGRKAISQLLSDRRAKIAEVIQEVEGRKNKAAAALAQEQKKLAQAKTEAERIRQTAQERSTTVQAEIAAQAQRDIQRMQETAAKDLTAEQDRVMAELKQRIAALALAQVESSLQGGLDDSTQQELINRSLAQLGGN